MSKPNRENPIRKPAPRIKGGSAPVIHGLSTWGWLVSVLLFCAVPGRAQISPGPLAKAHQSLSGDSNCTKCHQVSTRSPEFRCVDCHREVAREIEQNRGLHATYPRSGPPGSSCVKCHSDHNGADFQMIHWDPTPKGFDHAKTGYLLDGKHVGASCRSCHNPQHISLPERARLSSKDLNHTWFGLSPDCVTCHEDKHQGRFGAVCTQCHSTVDWKAAKIEQKAFDHSKTRYPLTGAHREVACGKCHINGPDGMPRYTGIPTAPCTACHQDPHQGEFKQGCTSCHNTSNWKDVTFRTAFDHSKTNYPLVGKHVDVPCGFCHNGGDFKAPMAFASCMDCHKDDPHGGQFAKRAGQGRCESCHTVQGWSPSTFSVADHAKTDYPLVFPHAGVKCAACHIPAGKQTLFKVRFARCIDCHKDEHAGQFAAAPWENRCEQCHKGATFKTTTFTLARHQSSSFPLTGGHRAVACNQCHKPAAGSEAAVYHFRQLDCATCHEDVHAGQFTEQMSKRDAAGRALGCEACHSTKEWGDMAKFDHGKTQFPLIGSHRAVACIDCHKPPSMEVTLLHVRFKSAPSACGECHENPHAGQFGTRAGDCAGCHNSNKWRPSLFDHGKTIFPLTGGHENVACSACHALQRTVGERLVLFYRPTPTACSACHGSNIPKAKGG